MISCSKIVVTLERTFFFFVFWRKKLTMISRIDANILWVWWAHFDSVVTSVARNVNCIRAEKYGYIILEQLKTPAVSNVNEIILCRELIFYKTKLELFCFFFISRWNLHNGNNYYHLWENSRLLRLCWLKYDYAVIKKISVSPW